MLIGKTTLALLSVLAVIRVDTIAAVDSEDDDDASHKRTKQDDDQLIEPPFPNILRSAMIENKKIKIISEVVGDDVGYQTTEEYADFEAGKAAYLVTSHDKGQEVVLSDTSSGSIFKYRPYKCEKFAANDKVYDNLNELSIHYETHDVVKAVFNGHKSTYLRMFGVVGLWMSATYKAKIYSQSNLIFSTSKDVYRPSHNWEYIDKDLSVTFHFIDANYKDKSKSKSSSDPPELSLEMIQIKSVSQKKILRTINVMLVDYWLHSDISNTYLQLPVGYGCLADEPQEPLDEAVTSYYSFDLDHGRAELELTETRILTDAAKGNKKTRATKTVNVELAHTIVNNFDLTLTRVKNKNEDIRTVYWNEFRTKFSIDMRKSSCQMSHLFVDDGSQQDNRQKRSVQSTIDEGRLIKFSKESAFPLDKEMLDLLFVQKEGFRFVKRTETSQRQAEHLYLEKEIPQWPYNLDGSKSSSTSGQPLARIIRNFVDSNHLEILESVTVWLFDATGSQIMRSYHINLIDYEELDPYRDVARVFDVSDECYLNNPQYRSGKQYAWIELFYPTTSRVNDLIAQELTHFKETIYKQFLSTPTNLHLNGFRMPRMELMFDDEGLIVRSLLLDRPPIELVFEPLDNTLLKPVKSNGPSDDIFEIQPDVSHCAKLCQLHSCKAMSYCQFDRTCWLRSERPPSRNDGGQSMSNVAGCQTYLLPRPQDNYHGDELTMKELLDSSLHQILGKLQHQDYGVVPLPRAPDEVLMPRGESGLDEAAYQQMLDDYTKELNRFLAEDAHRVPELSLVVMVNAHLFVLLASKFTVEDDPLDQFDLLGHEAEDSLDYGQNSDGDSAPDTGNYFHGVLSNSRYKLTSFLTGPERARQFDGLTYDQCALACLDNRCGSFSHCHSRRECIITSVNNTRTAQAMNSIDADYDCMISQRDFVKNFKLFEGVYAPAIYKKQTREMVNPSDCAFECISSTDFKCMSFQFCRASKTCYYQNHRHPAGIFATSTTKAYYPSSAAAAASSSSSSPPSTGCDHYERSVLADFNTIEYRQIEPVQLARFRTTTFEGKSIFQCADICANQLADCSAFQFCFNHRTALGQLRPQQCQMIQSKPGADEPADTNTSEQDFAVIVDDKNHDEVVKAGKYIIKSEQCHLFSLRRDTGEAHLRALALPNAMTLQESRELEASLGGAKGGLSLLGAFSLFVGVCLVATSVGFAVSIASERNDFIKQKIERGRLLLGV